MDIHLIQLHGCKPTHISRRPQGVYQNNYFKDNEFILSEKKKILFPGFLFVLLTVSLPLSYCYPL